MLKSSIESENARRAVGRRTFLLASGVALAGLAVWRYQSMESAHAEPAPAAMPKQVTLVDFTDDGGRNVVLPARIDHVLPAGPPASADLLILAPEKPSRVYGARTPQSPV